jgi:hypothetical protein
MAATRKRTSYTCIHTAENGTRCGKTIQHWTLRLCRKHFNSLGDNDRREIIRAPQSLNTRTRNNAPANNDNRLGWGHNCLPPSINRDRDEAALLLQQRFQQPIRDDCNPIDSIANADSISTGQTLEVNIVGQANQEYEQQRGLTTTTTPTTNTAGAIVMVIPPLFPFLEVNNVSQVQANQGCQQHMSTTTMMTAITIAAPTPPVPLPAIIQPVLPLALNNRQNDNLPSNINVPTSSHLHNDLQIRDGRINALESTSSHLHNELQIRDGRINALESAVEQLRTQLNDFQEQMRTQQMSAVNNTMTPTDIKLAFQEGCTGSADDDVKTFDISINTTLETNMNYLIMEASNKGRVNDSQRLDQWANENTSPKTQYYRTDFITPQRSNARCIATDGRNAGLVNNNVVCYANVIFQIIASCGLLNKALCNPPSITHQHFSLNYNFASVISSMIKGKNEVVNPEIFMGVFRDRFSQFNAEKCKYSVVINVLFLIGFLFTHQVFMLPNVRGCTRIYNGTEDVPAQRAKA